MCGCHRGTGLRGRSMQPRACRTPGTQNVQTGLAGWRDARTTQLPRAECVPLMQDPPEPGTGHPLSERMAPEVSSPHAN